MLLDPTANQNIDTRCGFCFIRPIGEACEIGKAGDQTHSVKIAEILLLVVHEKLSRLGLGTMIMKAIIDDLQKRQFHEVWLEVHAENQRAIALYQKAGFVVTSKRPKYYPDGADALNLKLAFKVPA
ncbi:MAG: GNAT family N-acetyltransferase [Pseudobdellovibrionaceae bacterium]